MVAWFFAARSAAGFGGRRDMAMSGIRSKWLLRRRFWTGKGVGTGLGLEYKLLLRLS